MEDPLTKYWVTVLQVLFKMDCNGDGVIIRLDQLSEVKPVADFTRQNFRHMCILAGCDYLPSVPGLGLSTACKLLKRNGRDPLRVIPQIIFYDLVKCVFICM